MSEKLPSQNELIMNDLLSSYHHRTSLSAMSETKAIASDPKKKQSRRRMKLPWTRSNNKSSEPQSTSNGSDRPGAVVGELVAAKATDLEAAKAKKEASAARAARWRQRRKNCVNFWKRFTSFLLSTIGLTILMVFYTIFGGFVFSWLEAPKELRTKHGVKASLQYHVALLWNLTEQMNVLHPKNWTEVAEEVVNNYTREVFKAIKDHGWDGKDEGEPGLQWSFAGSMLYSATVITTIGYGHIAPKTAFGRIATMLYALVGIPLTLLSITHMGGFMATVFRFLYKNIFCGLCCVLCQRRRATMEDNLKTTVVKQQLSSSMLPKPGLGSSTSSSSSNRPSNRGRMELDMEANEKNGLGGGVGSTVVRVEQHPQPPPPPQQGLQRSYNVVVQWRRGIRNALFTDDNQMVHVPIYISLLLISGYIALGAIMFGLWEDWGFLIGSYFCFITLSTIGFGDFVPGTSLDPSSSQEKLILCSLYLIFGLALLAMCFDLMQEEARSIFRGIGKRIGLVVTDEGRPKKVTENEEHG